MADIVSIDAKTVPKIKVALLNNREFHFEDGLNIVIGKNASGKTRLLNAIEREARSKDECILIDDFYTAFSNTKKPSAESKIKSLLESYDQVILTVTKPLRLQGIKANIIRMEKG